MVAMGNSGKQRLVGGANPPRERTSAGATPPARYQPGAQPRHQGQGAYPVPIPVRPIGQNMMPGRPMPPPSGLPQVGQPFPGLPGGNTALPGGMPGGIAQPIGGGNLTPFPNQGLPPQSGGNFTPFPNQGMPPGMMNNPNAQIMQSGQFHSPGGMQMMQSPGGQIQPGGAMNELMPLLLQQIMQQMGRGGR